MFNTTFAAAIVVAAAVIAIPTQKATAMDVGQCFSTDEMKQKLQEEGQQKIGVVDEPVVDPKPGTPLFEMRAFTADANGNGYILSGNQPKKYVSTKICVSMRLKDVKIFDARVPGVDPKARVREDRAMIKLECGGDPSCNPHNEALASDDRAGKRVMMQATRMRHQPDGTYKAGGLITLTGQMDGEKKGVLSTTTAAGACSIVTTFANVAYSEYAIRVLDERH